VRFILLQIVTCGTCGTHECGNLRRGQLSHVQLGGEVGAEVGAVGAATAAVNHKQTPPGYVCENI